jgi:hypothetical protein
MIPLVGWLFGAVAAHRVLTKNKSSVGLSRYSESVGAVTKADRLAYYSSHKSQFTSGFPSSGALPSKVRGAMGAAQNFFLAKIKEGHPSTSAANQAAEKYKNDVHLTRKLLLSALGGPLLLGVQIAVHKKIIAALKAMGTLDSRITNSGFKAPKPAKRRDLNRRSHRQERKDGASPSADPEDAAPEEEAPQQEEEEASSSAEEEAPLPTEEEEEPPSAGEEESFTAEEVEAAIEKIQGLVDRFHKRSRRGQFRGNRFLR